MPHIVAATDFSTRSQRALRRAGQLARQTGAALTLLHVVDDDQPAEKVARDVQEAEKYLNEQMESLAELRGVNCRAVVATNEPFEGILRTAEEVSADLIVMGEHRKQILRDVFVGTTVERVMRTGPYPVLMVNADGGQPYRSVVAAIDMSEPSAHAVKTARSIGLIGNAKLTFVHAFIALASGKLYAANVPREDIQSYVEDERSQARDELIVFLKQNELGGPSWSCRVEEGEPFDVISRVTKDIGADLVVIGTHGRSGLVRLLIGSVAEQAMRGLDVDVLAVPPQRKETND
jgi:universal stress protein E